MLSEDWDLVLASGYREKTKTVDGQTITYKVAPLQIAQGGYATAQNVANECRLFTRDAYFDQDRGIPYFLITLGHHLSPSVLRARLRDAAMLVEDVAEVTDIILETLDTDTRRLTGEIRFTSREGENASISL